MHEIIKHHENRSWHDGISWQSSVMIRSSSILVALNNILSRSRVDKLVGPRQSGKSTLAHELIEVGK
jgi:predicted AAA+ superfamily ATPase